VKPRRAVVRGADAVQLGREHDRCEATGSGPRWQCCEREYPNVLDTVKLCTRAGTERTGRGVWDVDKGGLGVETERSDSVEVTRRYAGRS
jgi:hypothetical protein